MQKLFLICLSVLWFVTMGCQLSPTPNEQWSHPLQDHNQEHYSGAMLSGEILQENSPSNVLPLHHTDENLIINEDFGEDSQNVEYGYILSDGKIIQYFNYFTMNMPKWFKDIHFHLASLTSLVKDDLTHIAIFFPNPAGQFDTCGLNYDMIVPSDAKTFEKTIKHPDGVDIDIYRKERQWDMLYQTHLCFTYKNKDFNIRFYDNDKEHVDSLIDSLKFY